MPRQKKVLIFGGGIAGLTVAHECIESGLEVHLFEQTARCGGKAVGYRLPKKHTFGGIPIEHSQRTYQSTYFSLFETMKRIPYIGRGPNKGKSVFDNLVALDGLNISILKKAKSDFTVNPSVNIHTSTHGSSLEKMISFRKSMLDFGISQQEIFSFIQLLLRYAFSTELRKEETIKNQTFAEYAEFNKRSHAYQEYLNSISEIIVAAKSNASAIVVMGLLSRLLLGSRLNVHGVSSSSNVMNGPTNERFIDPWVHYLQELGAKIHTKTQLKHLQIKSVKGKRHIQFAILENGEILKGDAYILALPPLALKHVLPDFFYNTPTKNISSEWSNGLQFFLKNRPQRFKSNCSFNLVLGSPWKLVYILQGEPLWQEVSLPHGVKAILSVTISNVNAKGVLYHKSFQECTWQEAQEEILAQIGFTEKNCILGSYMDPMLRYISVQEYQRHKNDWYNYFESGPIQDNGHLWINAGALTILNPQALKYKLFAKTFYSNLFMAGEHIDSFFITPTMEKANETGKLCAKEVLHYLGKEYEEERLLIPEEPFQWLRDIDSWIYGTRKKINSVYQIFS